MEETKTYAAIDLGSNSFHLVVAREVNGAVQWLDRMKQRVQLAQGLDEQGVLDEAAIARGRACLALFAERLQGMAAENVRAVGTFTLRQAQNREQVLQAFAEVFPYPIEIISGYEEAHLIYQGVAHTQADNGQRLVVDIGGGSTEIMVGSGFDVLRAESRHVGCVRDAVLYFSDKQPREQQFARAKESALAKLEDLFWDYRQLGWREALGCSGTIRAVSEAIIAYGWDSSGTITAEFLDRLQALWCDVNTPLLGVSEDRQGVIGAGLAILSALFTGLRISKMRYVESALREGLLYGALDTAEQEISARTVESLQRHYHVDRQQAQRVQNTVHALLRGINFAEERQQSALLRVASAAAALHDVGRIVHSKAYQKHSAYLMANSDLWGFTQAEKQLLVWLLRYQRKGLKGAELELSTDFATADQWLLLLVLRLAIIVNRMRVGQGEGQVSEIMLSALEEGWCVEFAPQNPPTPLLAQALQEEQQILAKSGIVLTL